MKSSVLLVIAAGLGTVVLAHDLGKTPITWNREISRIVYDHCASCHRPGGTAFSLLAYEDVQPRLVAFRNSVLSRRMPPWGAVKGFGDFRNDEGLTQEQLELINNWVEQDAPKGNNPNVLPKLPIFASVPEYQSPRDGIEVTGDLTLVQPLTLDGLLPVRVPPNLSLRIVAVSPQGNVEPLLWLYEYKNIYQHPFLLRRALNLSAGTAIRGVPASAAVVLIPKTARGSR